MTTKIITLNCGRTTKINEDTKTIRCYEDFDLRISLKYCTTECKTKKDSEPKGTVIDDVDWYDKLRKGDINE